MTEIRTLADDQKITENGIYDLPIQRYHHDPHLCDGPSISSSGLRKFDECPEKYWRTSPFNPNREPEDEKPAYSFGRAAHALVVEGELPSEIVVSPFDDFRKKEAREWRDGCLERGITIVKPADIEAINKMAERLAKEPLVQNGLFRGVIEASLVWKDEATGLWLRSRPDCIPQDSILSDYKTAVSAAPDDIQRDLKKYGYAQQLALAAEGMARVMGRAVDSFVLVVQEKTAPYTVTVAAIDDETIQWGARLNRMAINRFALCLKENDWPGYSEGPITLGFPAYETKKLEAHTNIIPEVPSLKEMAAHV